MTELAIRDETAVATPAPAQLQQQRLPVPAMSDIDSWTQIVGQVIRLANEIYDTPFVPEGLRGSAPAVAAAMLAGREMGIGPMTSLANIDVIRGKPTQKPLLMRAMILSAGHKWADVENNDTRAVVRGCRRGESEWTTVSFTADQARKAGLDLGKYPADKLYARASSRLAKHRFADVIMGMASSDDVEDGVDVEIDTTTGDVGSGSQAAAIEAPKARTAQRAARQRAASPPPAQQPPTPPSAADAGGDDLPPLPGEEDPTASGASSSAAPDRSRQETGEQSPSSSDGSGSEPVTNRQLTAIWTQLTRDFDFGDDEKEQARMACGLISGRGPGLASTKDLTKRDAGTVIDTLGHLVAQSVKQQEHPRTLLIALLAKRENEVLAKRENEVPDGE